MVVVGGGPFFLDLSDCLLLEMTNLDSGTRELTSFWLEGEIKEVTARGL